MSETEKDFIEEYGKQYSRMRNTLVTIIIAIITICIGQWFFSSREQRKVNKDTDEKIASIVKNVEDVMRLLRSIIRFQMNRSLCSHSCKMRKEKPYAHIGRL